MGPQCPQAFCVYGHGVLAPVKTSYAINLQSPKLVTSSARALRPWVNVLYQVLPRKTQKRLRRRAKLEMVIKYVDKRGVKRVLGAEMRLTSKCVYIYIYTYYTQEPKSRICLACGILCCL